MFKLQVSSLYLEKLHGFMSSILFLTVSKTTLMSYFIASLGSSKSFPQYKTCLFNITCQNTYLKTKIVFSLLKVDKAMFVTNLNLSIT